MSPSERPAARDEAGNDEIDLFAMFQVLWRGRIFIGACLFAAIMIGGIYAYVLATPIYRASAVVMLETRQSASLGLESVLGALSSDNSTVNTEVEVFKGRRLMGRVVDALDLNADPEFNDALNPPGLITRLRAMIRPPGAEPSEEERRDRVVSALLEKVQIRNTPNSLVFQVTVESESARKAAQIADKLAELYIEDQLRVRFDATSAATRWLSDQVVVQKQAYDAADTAVRNFRATTSVFDAVSLGALDRQIKDSRRRIEQIEQRMAELDLQITAAASPAEQVINDRARLAAQLRALREAELNFAADFERQSKELTQLDQLSREAESSRLLYEHFQTRLKETAAQQGINQADSRILSQAVIPSGAAAPRKPLILVLSAFLGLMLGAAIMLLREMRANRIRTSRELEMMSGTTVLAQIPRIPESTRQGVIAYLARNPASAAAEAVRNLRTALLFSSEDTPPKVIAMTSSVPGEGKTTTTVALAQNLTAMGKKVLVIEGDVRIRTLDNYAPLSADKERSTITSLLLGTGSLAQAVQKIDGIGDMIFGDKAKLNAADLFSSPRFAEVIAEARASYDMVLIDTPPVLVVPDARIIAQQADGVVFVVHWDRTTREQVAESLRQIGNLRLPIIGTVLTRVDPKRMREYGYGDTYGAYASYGDRYYISEK